MLFASLAAFAAPEATAVVLVQREARDEGFALELDGWIADDALPHVVEGAVVLLGPDGREPLDVRPGEVWTVEGASGTPWMARLHEEVDPDRLILRGDLAALREIAVLLDARITVQADDSALIERPGVLLDVGWLADEEEGRAVEDVELVRGRPTREEAVLRAHLPAARPSQADRERRFADALLARLAGVDEATHAVAAALSTPEATSPPTPPTVPDDEALEAARRRYAGRHLCGETFVVLHPSGAFAGAGYRGTWTPVQDGLIRVSSGDLERAFLVTFHPGHPELPRGLGASAVIWKELRAFLKASWPRVASHDVMSVLQAGARWDEPLPEPLAELAALAPVEVATALMVPVASAMHDRKPWDRIEVLGALDALIRAGGDPSAILPDVIGALDVERTREAAGGVLHRTALHGNPIHTALSALAPYAGSRHGGLRDAHTLAALQAAGQGDAVERVGAVVRGLAPYGDLQGAIGLVEHQLLASDTRAVDQARVVLDGLLEAVPDRGAAWLAVVPVLCTQLRSAEPSWRREAAQAAGKARHVLAGPAPGGRLEPLVEALADCLAHSDDGVAGQAASALGALVATGGSLASVRARVDAALLDPREAVRSAVSPALSAWLVAAGLEETLPPGRSHRRIWALTDTPVEGPVVCPHCGDPGAAVIHRYHHRRQFGEDNLVETCCPACRVYSVETYGYDH